MVLNGKHVVYEDMDYMSSNTCTSLYISVAGM